MRYEVGGTYMFLVEQYKNRMGESLRNGLFNGVFLPWEHMLLNIHVELLTCIEHHRVPNAYDMAETPECKHDGFVFRSDDTGAIWHNQYPRAIYGQSDANDRVANRNLLNEKAESLNDELIICMNDAMKHLASIHGAVYRMMGNPDPHAHEHACMLSSHAEAVQAAMEKKSGHKLIVERLIYGPDNKWLEGHYRVKHVANGV